MSRIAIHIEVDRGGKERLERLCGELLQRDSVAVALCRMPSGLGVAMAMPRLAQRIGIAQEADTARQALQEWLAGEWNRRARRNGRAVARMALRRLQAAERKRPATAADLEHALRAMVDVSARLASGEEA